MKRSISLLMGLVLCTSLHSQDSSSFGLAASVRSVALEGSILGNWDGIHTDLGLSARYDHKEQEGWGFAHLLLGLPVSDSGKVDVLIGPEAGVLPGGKGALGFRVELAFRPTEALRVGVFVESYLASADYPKAQGFAFAGWCF